MQIQFGDRKLDGELIYQPDFSTLDDFWCEGSQDVHVKANHLFIKTNLERDPEYTFICSVFSKKFFKGDLLAEFYAQDVHEESHGNFNMFIHTTMRDGRDLYETRKERTGDYPEYHVMNNYLYTFLRSSVEGEGATKPRARYRLRRDPGFILKKEVNSYEWEHFRWYKFQFLIKDGIAGISVDDNPFETYCWKDEEPLTEGYLAFRTFRSHLEIKDFKIYQV